MDKIIYTSMTGANAAAQRQAVLAHNLANAGTNGFRAEMSTFRSVPLQGTGAGTRVFALEATSGYQDTPGPAQRTGRALDAMAMGRAWFAVQGLDGQEAYTRNGVFEISPEGQLVNSNGQAVLSDGGAPIDIPPESTISLGSDGTLTAKMGNQLPVAVARLLSGSIEGSNVNSVETMVGMIAASRQFEQQMKLLQTAETNDKSASQLLSLNG